MNSYKFLGVIFYLVIIFLLIFGLVSVLNMASGASRSVTSYSSVMAEFDSLNVSEFELDLGSGSLTYRLKGEDGTNAAHSYTVPNISKFNTLLTTRST